jgi:hypothetical protein
MHVCVLQNWVSPAWVYDPTVSGDDDVETAAEEVAAVEAAELVAAEEVAAVEAAELVAADEVAAVDAAELVVAAVEVATVVAAELLVAGVAALPAQALRPTAQARTVSVIKADL